MYWERVELRIAATVLLVERPQAVGHAAVDGLQILTQGLPDWAGGDGGEPLVVAADVDCGQVGEHAKVRNELLARLSMRRGLQRDQASAAPMIRRIT